MNDEPLIFIKRGETVRGPVTWQHAVSLAKQARLRDSDQIALDKAGPWQAVGTIAGLREYAASKASASDSAASSDDVQAQGNAQRPSSLAPWKVAGAAATAVLALGGFVLATLSIGWPTTNDGRASQSSRLAAPLETDYAQLYELPPNSRIVVDTVAQESAELGVANPSSATPARAPSQQGSAMPEAEQPTTVDDMYVLGRKYYDATDRPKDDALAFSWLLKSAEGGLNIAMYDLACFYKNGVGTAASDDQWRHWMLKAANAGDSMAMYHLAQAIEAGEFPEQSKNYWYWLHKAERAGNPGAKAELAAMRSHAFRSAAEALEISEEETIRRHRAYAEWAADPANQ